MTNLALELDPELLSSTEVVPHAPAPPPPAPNTLDCPYCDWVRSGPTRYGLRAIHIRSAHPGQPVPKAGGTPKKKGAPKKAAAARKTATPAAPKAPGVTTPPPPPRRRTPAGELIGQFLLSFGSVIKKVDPPVGQAIEFEAGAAGVAIDGVVAGTFVDRLVVQPIANAQDKWEALSDVAQFPVLVYMFEHYPSTRDALEEHLRDCFVNVLVQSIPVMKKKKEREEKVVKALEELGNLDPKYKDSVDPVSDMLTDIFNGAEEAAGDAPPAH